MRGFFYGIEDLFVNYLFLPFDFLRSLAESDWWMSNIVGWFFFLIGFTAFVYWMLQLKSFDDKKEENKSITAHSYL
ncbi:MAG: uracil phosphoribosyltransferase [Flavobacteriales bacterium]|jgi:predicted permease|nr:uracil phosphoribosyltransferase [Flavobacteriaceae bacterium]RZP05411.1 MAG: uracil phosphoribosyltransferase [Flavobacteriales bacterium]|tara:strand:- start:133 stop:360 length:228 start_codon:yes stop_codon:yes gene_type:complete